MGTHVGCERGVGGACTILLDGEPPALSRNRLTPAET